MVECIKPKELAKWFLRSHDIYEILDSKPHLGATPKDSFL